MNITVIYGTQRKAKSSTYNLARRFLSRLSGPEDTVTEFFLPQSMPHFCVGCWNCFTDHTTCPHYGQLKPMVEAMLAADLLVFTAPVYVYHAPGQLKAFLDHFGYQWMSHQPRQEMFYKQALIISTAAGAGTRSAIKDVKDSLEFWGVARIYTFGRNVFGADWETLKAERREKLLTQADGLAQKIKAGSDHVRPSLKVKLLFYVMRFMQQKFHFNPADVRHWEAHGWLGSARPWRQPLSSRPSEPQAKKGEPA